MLFHSFPLKVIENVHLNRAIFAQTTMSGIYLHIPFCKQACHYCDFHFSTDKTHSGELLEAMITELSLQKEYLHDPVSTIYFGGGTPSILKAGEIEHLLNAISKHYPLGDSREITMEVNPDDLTLEKLNDLKKAGINRLSIGIQSFDNELLKFLNRAHDGNAAERSIQLARDAGFENISIDLIYAIPGLSLELWRETVLKALAFSPEHISSYALTIEDRTVFGNRAKKGKLIPVQEEAAALQFEALTDMLSEAGYLHYEISNFSRPELQAKHNSNYWKGAHYLGIGPSAHSFDGTSRQYNVRNNAQYVRSISNGESFFEREILSQENKINEYILTTLRTMWGVDLLHLKQTYGDDLAGRKHDYLNDLVANNLITINKNVIMLTRKGKLLADKITEDLIL